MRALLTVVTSARVPYGMLAWVADTGGHESFAPVIPAQREVALVDVSVTRTSEGSVPVVAVSGEVDVYSAPALKEQFAQLVRDGAATLVVDLTDVAFLDSTGLGALVEARALTGDAGGALPIVCTQERILKLFTITGLDGVFSIHPSVDAALAASQS